MENWGNFMDLRSDLYVLLDMGFFAFYSNRVKDKKSYTTSVKSE